MTSRPALLALAGLALVLACSSGLPPAGGVAPAAPTPAPAPATPTGPPVDPALPPSDPGPTPAPYEATGVEGDLDVRRLGTWAQSPYQRPERQVIQDQEGLNRLWARLGAQERPQVDFATDLVVVAAAGQRPSGGYDISVRRAELENGRLRLEVLETTPGRNCITTAALTQPVEVIAVRAARAEGWEFVERREQRDC